LADKVRQRLPLNVRAVNHQRHHHQRRDAVLGVAPFVDNVQRTLGRSTRSESRFSTVSACCSCRM
jgi:hypothetical protein